MDKPKTLRAEIEKHLPEIKANPEKLVMNITNGKIMANKNALSHSTDYTLNLFFADFAGDLEILKTVIIHWAQTHQPNILGAGYMPNNQSFSFEADILGHDSYDVLIELPLTERTLAQVNDQKQIEISHPRNANYSDLDTALGRGIAIP